MTSNKQLQTEPTSNHVKNLSQATILVVDDEKTLRDTLEYNLRREGYRVLTTPDGNEAIRLAYDEQPDLIILDIMLPCVSGFDVCRAVRKQLTMPVLMLSAREDEIDKVLGLELGADDYLTKPFGLRELLARVRAMLRRAEMMPSGSPATLSPGESSTASKLTTGNLVINTARHTVTRAGQPVELKPKEFDLLVFL